MKDFHTHILPEMDDGSFNTDMSIEMLNKLKSQGIDSIVLTPHYYFDCECVDNFLDRRRKCLHKLIIASKFVEDLPQMYIGAEVAFFPNMSNHEGLDKLCIEGTKYMLLEMPFARWQKSHVEEVDKIYINRGIIPIIAHIERYIEFQKGTQYVNELLDLNVLIQINSEILKKKNFVKKHLSFIIDNEVYLLGSDCHNMEGRAPNMDIASKYMKKKFKNDKLKQIDLLGEEVLKNAISININPD
ncbi:MAG TPA: CpsB/CapC family capsule biosynthesis tyrosine phosphatase [Anaerovoracaceae bacterium]|nr:CpsB/CapC family capsule biosynthesis tyrosine phosphatase [Anaerovoracaceae bacterium]